MDHVAGRLYVGNTAGTTFVLEPNPKECKILAENKLGETTRASAAFSNGQIFIRTHQNLYCIEAKQLPCGVFRGSFCDVMVELAPNCLPQPAIATAFARPSRTAQMRSISVSTPASMPAPARRTSTWPSCRSSWRKCTAAA